MNTLASGNNYLEMVLGIPVLLEDGRIVTAGAIDQKRIAAAVDTLRALLMRRDRIIWAMRYLKLAIAKELLHVVRKEISEQSNKKDYKKEPSIFFFESMFGSLPKLEQPGLEDIIQKMSWIDIKWAPNIEREPVFPKVIQSLTGNTIRYPDEGGREIQNHIRHSMEMIHAYCIPNPMVDGNGKPIYGPEGKPRMRAPLAPHHPLEKTIWDRQSFDEIQRILKKESEDIAESFRGYTTEMGRKIIDLGSNAWFDLECAYSQEEAAAMGHCGNAAWNGIDKKSCTILSYREGHPKKGWKPHLTFILHSKHRIVKKMEDGTGKSTIADGWLGEMKGRGNRKPSSKHHDAIVALLKTPLISEVRGGGYLPSANFCLFVSDGMSSGLNGWTDLSAEHAKDLHDANPEIWNFNGTCQYCKNTVIDKSQMSGAGCLGKKKETSVPGFMFRRK